MKLLTPLPQPFNNQMLAWSAWVFCFSESYKSLWVKLLYAVAMQKIVNPTSVFKDFLYFVL